MSQPDTAGEIPFDLQAQRRELADRMAASGELDALVSRIRVYDTQSILTFGQDAAARIAQCSSRILRSMETGQIPDSGPLLASLGRVMGRFDAEELTGTRRPGLMARLRGGAPGPDALVEKYRALGGEVDKVYIELKRYEAGVQTVNQGLSALLEASLSSYLDLVKYVLAGEQGLREIDAYLADLDARLAGRPGDVPLQMDRDAVRQARTLLDRRVQDLRVSEVTALQAVPMLQTMRRSNLGLIQKLQTAFLTTLPIFKQALNQAVLLKRRQLQSRAMEALEARAERELQTARRSSESEPGQDQDKTLERTWRTIMDGIGETRALQAGAEARRTADAAKLAALCRPLPSQ